MRVLALLVAVGLLAGCAHSVTYDPGLAMGLKHEMENQK